MFIRKPKYQSLADDARNLLRQLEKSGVTITLDDTGAHFNVDPPESVSSYEWGSLCVLRPQIVEILQEKGQSWRMTNDLHNRRVTN